MNPITLRTSIKPSLLKRKVSLGTLLAFIGSSILVYASLTTTIDQLQRFGWLYFILAIGLIAAGLIPYRKLSKIEEHPNKLLIENESLYFIKNEKIAAAIPLSAIREIQFLESKNRYGIEIKTEKKCYFFEYFSEKSYARLHDIVKSD